MENKETQKSIYNSEHFVERSGFLNEFLWICAGVDRKVLRQCPTDYAKYAGTGGTILFTALMAMLSGGYAMFSVFDNRWVAIAFGIFWGLLIFNLDRFIVNTMYSDGKVTISWREFYSGLPRIIMAIFLGVVISTPLELKIFEDEISVKIEEMKKSRLEDYTAADQLKLDSLKHKRLELVQSPVDPLFAGQLASSSSRAIDLNNQRQAIMTKRDGLNRNILSIQKQINAKEREKEKYEPITAEYASLQADINQLISQRAEYRRQLAAANAEYTNVSASLNNESDIFAEAMGKAEKQREQDLAMMKEEIDDLDSKVKNASSEYASVINKDFGGFQAKMLAFSQMKEENTSTKWTALFIMLLFVIIETTPTFFKMMIASGPYDDLLRAEMHRVRVLSDKRISDVNDEVNTEVKISVEKNKERLDAELAANKAVLDKIAKAQAELLDVAVEAWREEEMEKVKNNPSAYIKTSTVQKSQS
jgi:hypothetical protein